MHDALDTYLVVVVTFCAIFGVLLLMYAIRGFIMSDFVARLRTRGGEASNDKKTQQANYGPVEAFKLSIDEKSDSPDNYPALVVEMDGRGIVAISFMGRGLPFIVRQADKERVTGWKRFYAALSAGRITEIKGYRPKLFGQK